MQPSRCIKGFLNNVDIFIKRDEQITDYRNNGSYGIGGVRL